MAAQSSQRNQAFCVTASDWSPSTSACFSVKIKMAAPMEVSLPQTMLQKLLDLLTLESLKFCLKIHVHVICNIRCQVNVDYHNQHESAALIESISRDLLGAAICGELPELLETDAERSTGVPLLSAAESNC